MVRSNFFKLLIAFSFIFIIMGSFVFANPKPYKKNVVVSYYGEDFHGKKTSNGEIFNMYSMTCAHKSLPFDTILRITNKANGKWVDVRVNDRGPFVDNREVDLSKGAASKIGMLKSGIARVDIEIVKLGPDTKLSRETAAGAVKIMRKKGLHAPDPYVYDSKPSKPNNNSGSSKSSGKVHQSPPVINPQNMEYPEGTYWDIQVGAYSHKENANKLAQTLLRKGFKNVVFQKSSDVYRVVIRDVPASQMKAMEDKLARCGYKNIIVRQRLK